MVESKRIAQDGTLIREEEDELELQGAQLLNRFDLNDTIIEGWLKRPMSFIFSRKDYFKITGKVLLMASNPKKKFTTQYDLANYQVQLSQGNSRRFYLWPLDNSLGLEIVTFEAQSVDERARWYDAINQVVARSKS